MADMREECLRCRVRSRTRREKKESRVYLFKVLDLRHEAELCNAHGQAGHQPRPVSPSDLEVMKLRTLATGSKRTDVHQALVALSLRRRSVQAMVLEQRVKLLLCSMAVRQNWSAQLRRLQLVQSKYLRAAWCLF